MSVGSLSSLVVSLLLAEMIGFSFEPVHRKMRAARILGFSTTGPAGDGHQCLTL